MLNFFTSNRQVINGLEEKRISRSMIPAGVFIPGRAGFPFSVLSFKESQPMSESVHNKGHQGDSKHAG